MQVHRLRCFGAAPGSGNLALVIENGPATQDERQAFARAANAGACVFISAPASAGEPVDADYYYPHMRSPLCLHATLAAARNLCARGADAPLLKTAMRGQLLGLSHGLDGTFASVRRQAVAPIGIAPGLPAQLLGEPGLRLASPALLSSVGSPKLLIEVTDAGVLHALRPPLDRIAAWSREHAVSGCYVYCRTGHDESARPVFEGRNFNHLDPLLEDSATGVAAGALSGWLGQALVMLQGAALGNPCRILTRVDGDAVLVGGATELLAR